MGLPVYTAGDEQFTGGVLLSKLGFTGFNGISAAANGTTGSTLDITVTGSGSAPTSSSGWALLANGDYLDTTQLVNTSVAGNTVNGTYTLWLDESTDGNHTPAWSVAASAPSTNALAVASVTVASNVISAVVMLPGGITWPRRLRHASGSVARTDLTAKKLFTLPAAATIVALTIGGTAVSNAGTTATVSVGYVGGAATAFVNAYDVKGATGAGLQTPPCPIIGTAAALQVTGTYAETGSASSAGGPWYVNCLYFV